MNGVHGLAPRLFHIAPLGLLRAVGMATRGSRPWLFHIAAPRLGPVGPKNYGNKGWRFKIAALRLALRADSEKLQSIWRPLRSVTRRSSNESPV